MIENHRNNQFFQSVSWVVSIWLGLRYDYKTLVNIDKQQDSIVDLELT